MADNDVRSDILKMITGKYVMLWGVPEQIDTVSESGETEEIGIMQFSPKDSHFGHVYATNGLSQQSRNPAQQSELCVIVASPQDWVLNMLQALCLYPTQYHTEFTIYDTLQLGNNLNSLGYSALMFIPLIGTGYEPFLLVSLPNRLPIFLNQCIGINESELDFAIHYGGRKVWETISQNNKSILLDESRLTHDG